MNTRARSNENSLEAQCFDALQKLQDCGALTPEEQALHDRIVETQDPMDWQNRPEDAELASAMWDKMKKSDLQKIQMAAIISDLRGLRAVAACPPNGYI